MVDFVDQLDPHREPGRVTLACRMGAQRAPDLLPAIISRVTAADHEVVWQCDPLPENVSAPFRTRSEYVDRVVSELDTFFEVHHQLGTWPGGMTMEPIDIDTAFEDPRLDEPEAIEVAAYVGAALRRRPATRTAWRGPTTGVDEPASGRRDFTETVR